MSTNATDETLGELAREVGRRLATEQRQLATAESCTGGWIAKALTDVAGSSAWFGYGFVTYSDAAKRDLGVASGTLEAGGAVSEGTVKEMALGALECSGADLAVAVSGIAGPAGAVAGKPVGTVWFAWAWRRRGEVEVRTHHESFAGDREAVRRQTVARALEGVLDA